MVGTILICFAGLCLILAISQVHCRIDKMDREIWQALYDAGLVVKEGHFYEVKEPKEAE